MFALYCRKTNYLVTMPKVGSNRFATKEPLLATKWASREEAALALQEYADSVMTEEGDFFREDHEVLDISEFYPDTPCRSLWPHINVTQTYKYLEARGVKEQKDRVLIRNLMTDAINAFYYLGNRTSLIELENLIDELAQK